MHLRDLRTHLSRGAPPTPERAREALLRRCLLSSFAVYLSFGAAIALCTWAVAERDGGVGAVFGAMLFFYVPSLVAPYFMGFLVDKNTRRPWLSLAAAALSVATLALLWQGGLSHALICAVLALTSYVREFSNILVRKRIATHCRAESAVALNGRETTARRIGYLLGTLLGGALLALASLELAFLVLLLTLLGAAHLLQRVERAHGGRRQPGRLRTSFTRVRENLHNTQATKWIALIVVHTLISELLSSSLAAFVLLRISDNPMIMSVVSNAYILGALLGGALLGRVLIERRVVMVLGLSMAALGVAVYALSLTASAAGAIAAYFVVGVLFQGRILCQALLQTEFEPAHQAKLQSFVSMLSGATTMLTLALLTGNAAALTPELVHQAIALGLLLLSAGFALRALAAQRRARQPLRGDSQLVQPALDDGPLALHG
ncbi:MFS transporter [Haliangium ochraceum]|uniref:Major facilitator superfamily MFS_1 n=1 Tax=Haliangium ochraceum (strain DSM 14365 / JCM 11303 / SMP-2) TaxID=502025 RepID=D0LRJ8_HALO1|nr:MFS transporter [Haliangium ochraceum]ACY17226.1 major facilitator superfamily MFS_1 [Haliangium ochraceum DSM 14365]